MLNLMRGIFEMLLPRGAHTGYRPTNQVITKRDINRLSRIHYDASHSARSSSVDSAGLF